MKIMIYFSYIVLTKVSQILHIFKDNLCRDHGIVNDHGMTGVTINICPQSTSEYCEVFFNQGEVDGVQINSCADYCASYGLKCVHSYTINEYTHCYDSQFMTEFPEGPYQYTTCEVPYDARYGIGCVCGKSKLQTYLNTN